MKLVEHWQWHVTSAWSSWVTGAWAVLIGYLIQYPEQQEVLIGALPDALEPVAGFLLGVAVWSSIKGVAVIRQRRPQTRRTER